MRLEEILEVAKQKTPAHWSRKVSGYVEASDLVFDAENGAFIAPETFNNVGQSVGVVHYCIARTELGKQIDEIKMFRNRLRSAYTNLNASQFAHRLERADALNSNGAFTDIWVKEMWQRFMTLCNTFAEFDDETLAKIIFQGEQK